MPNTTNFGWATPADTDLVKDGAAAIRTLGSSIDTSLVDLKGGTTGQVLSKTSGTDLDFSWVAQDDSNAIQNAIVDAKGDLISATAADTPAILAVGTNGQILSADSLEATGLKWVNNAAVDAQLTTKESTYFLAPRFQAATTFNPTEDVTFYVPIYVNEDSFDRIAFRTASTHSGSSTIRLGIYNYDPTTGKPSTVVVDGGTVSVSAASTITTVTISQTLGKGYYFLALNHQNTNASARLEGWTNNLSYYFTQSSQAFFGAEFGLVYIQTGVTGAFATASATLPASSNDDFPQIGLRIA